MLDHSRFPSTGVPDGECIRVRSRRGDLKDRAQYTERQRAGELFVPFVKLQKHAANFLTNSALDPDSRIPEYKVCAVRIDKVGEERGATRARPIEAVASSLIR